MWNILYIRTFTFFFHHLFLNSIGHTSHIHKVRLLDLCNKNRHWWLQDNRWNLFFINLSIKTKNTSLHLPVFWIAFLARTVQVEFHRQEFYLHKRKKIGRVSKKKKIKKGNCGTPENGSIIHPTTLKLRSELGKVLIK